MAEIKESFQSLYGAAHSRYHVDQTNVDPRLDQRYCNHHGIRFYENGRVELPTGLVSRDPGARDCVGRIMGVRISLLNDMPAPVFPDGTPCPKAWVVDNPVCLYDYEFNVILPMVGWGGSIVYPHPGAQPYRVPLSSNGTKYEGFKVSVPRKADVDALMKDQQFLDLWVTCVAEVKMGALTRPKGGSVFLAWMRVWQVTHPEDSVRWELGGNYTKPALRSFLNEQLRDLRAVPYLRAREGKFMGGSDEK